MWRTHDNSSKKTTQPQTIVGLSDYVFGSAVGALQIEGIDFNVSPGEVCAIEAPNPDDGRVLLKALAT